MKVVLPQINFTRDPASTMSLTYTATLNVREETALFVSTLPHSERQRRGTRAAGSFGLGLVRTTALIRIGILALPLGNALKLVGNLGMFNSVGYGVPAATEADIAAGPSFFLGNLFGSILPVILAIFGVFALFGYLADRAKRRTLVTALVCSVLGIGITLSALGVITYAIPALATTTKPGTPAR
jgi:hypothetical protein